VGAIIVSVLFIVEIVEIMSRSVTHLRMTGEDTLCFHFDPACRA